MSNFPTKADQKLMANALEKTTSLFTQMCQESPQAVIALTDLWRLWADPNTSVQAFTECFDALIENNWIESTELLEIAIDLQRPNALKALGLHMDFSNFGSRGFHLFEETDDEPDNVLYPRRNRGWVVSAMFNRDQDTVDLMTMAEVSQEPTVWCDSLPMVGQRVTWLELALAAGHWKTAEVLWKSECEQGPLADQTYARLALAWMAGLTEFNRSRWSGSVSKDPSQAQDMLVWWDRLLPTTYLMLEEVPVKPVWAHRVMRGVTGGRPSHEDIPPPAAVRPLDMLLEVVALVSAGDWVGDKLAQRMRAVDWSTVPVDGWGRTAAQAALNKHARAAEGQHNYVSAFDAFWVNMLRDLPTAAQEEWWKQAFDRVLEDPAPLAAAAPQFKGRYAIEDTVSLAERVTERIEQQANRRGVSKQLRIDQAELAQRLVSRVVPAVMACCDPEAKAIWKGYREGLKSALKETDASADPGSPAWRALDLLMRLPLVPAPTQPKVRF